MMLPSGAAADMLYQMNSLPFVILLIINVLTCPLRCLSCESHTANKVESSSDICACCAQCESDAASDEPDSNESLPQHDDCGCESCFCEGAVTEHSVELPDPGPELTWLLPPELHLIHAAEVAGFVRGNAFESHGIYFLGRDARIAHQSWQI